MKTILNRYLLSNFLKHWLLVFAGLMGLYYLLGVLELILRQTVPLAALIKYFLYLSTEIFMQISGIISVLAMSLSLDQLTKNNRLLICQNLGQSIKKILKPIFVFSLFLSFGTLIVLTYLNPILLKKAKKIYYQEVWKQKIPSLSLGSDKIWYASDNFIFNLAVVDAKRQAGKQLSLYKFSKQWTLDYFIKAKSVKFIPNSLWKLQQGQIYTPQNDNSMQISNFKEKIISSPPKIKYFHFSIEFYKYMNSFDLYNFVKNNKNLGLSVIKYQIEYYSRFLLSFSGLLLLFVFSPFVLSSSVNRFAGKQKHFVGVLMAIFYWFFYTSSLKLALIFNSISIIFLPFLLFFILGLIFWKKCKI